MINKTLLIPKTLYLGYSLLYSFDNAISYLVYAKDILQTQDINKKCERKQLILCNRWFDQRNDCII